MTASNGGCAFFVSGNSSSRQVQHRKEGHPEAITKVVSAGTIPVMPLSWGVIQLDISPREILAKIFFPSQMNMIEQVHG
jgi:hypothetical protein